MKRVQYISVWVCVCWSSWLHPLREKVFCVSHEKHGVEIQHLAPTQRTREHGNKTETEPVTEIQSDEQQSRPPHTHTQVRERERAREKLKPLNCPPTCPRKKEKKQNKKRQMSLPPLLQFPFLVSLPHFSAQLLLPPRKQGTDVRMGTVKDRHICQMRGPCSMKHHFKVNSLIAAIMRA